MTLNGVMVVFVLYDHLIRQIQGPITSQWLKIDPFGQKCSPKNIVFFCNINTSYGDIIRLLRKRAI